MTERSTRKVTIQEGVSKRFIPKEHCGVLKPDPVGFRCSDCGLIHKDRGKMENHVKQANKTIDEHDGELEEVVLRE